MAVALLAGTTGAVVTEGTRRARAQPSDAPTDARPFGERIRFRHLGPRDGLLNARVHAIHQDSLGFLWFGTEDGLARYDGAEMRVYRPVPFDTTSLSGAWAIALASSDDGGFYVLNENGPLNRYDPRRDAFSLMDEKGVVVDGAALLASRDGMVWIGGRLSGLYRHDPTRGTTERVRASGMGDYVSAIAEETSGRLWVATRDAGLARIDGETITPLPHDPADARSVPSDFAGALMLDRSARLWVGTDRGLAVSSDGEQFDAVEALREDEVWSLLEDPAGGLWVGTSRGLVHLDPATGRTVRYVHDPSDPASLGSGEIRALFLDRAGTMWAATEAGLSSFAWAAPPFENIGAGPNGLSNPGVWTALAASDGTLWVGTEGGLDGIAPDGSIRRFRSDGTAATIGPGWVMTVYEESGGTLLVGTRRHLGKSGFLVRLDPATGRVLRRFDASNGLDSDNPWVIRRDRRGRLWVLSGGPGCPSVFDLVNGTFTPHCLGSGRDARYAAKAFAEDGTGGLWFATWGGGLVRLDPSSGETRQVTHDPADPNTPPNSNIADIVEGSDGALWLGTYGAGLSRFDLETGVFTHYHTANSALSNDVVYAIEPDETGRLWLSSNDGLTRFDPETETFETFGLTDGIQDLEFNAGASHRGADGALYFGGINGLNRFYPDRIRSTAVPLSAVVTRVSVEGTPAPIDPDDGLDAAAPYARTVRLGADQRDVSFTVSAPGAAWPVRYRVRLDDGEWRAPGARRTATYTNLDPGRHTFQVQATAGTAWNGPERTLAIVVAPRWYQAWWFRLLAALTLAGGTGFVLRERAQSARRREVALEATVADRTEALRDRTLALEAEQQTTAAQAARLREIARLRTRFFTNVSHEFRTPLTLTLGPLQDLSAEALSDTGRRSVDLALRNSRRLLRLTNQLLDAARLDAGEMTLRARPLDLAAAVRATALSFTAHAERRNVAFGIETPDEPVIVWADADKLEAILSNLLSNAFKFTPEGGAVRVSVTAGETARVEVRDNGPGIAADDLPHVFDRFYRVDESAQIDGTGIGLSLARDMTALHGGSLGAESVAGLGSLFTLSLPLGHGHLPDHQVVPPVASGDALESPPVFDTDEDPTPDDDDRTTVLIADDNADIRAYVRGHLADHYRVLEAPDGAEALRIARRETPDLIVSDVMMPVLDGVGLVRALRADPETDFIPVILLTAKAEEADVQVGLDAGADDYVVKPFNVRTLQARIHNLIASRYRLRARFGPSGAAPARPAPVRASEPDAAFLATVCDAIDARIDDEDLSVEDLAAVLGMTRSTLHRRLKAGADVTPSALIRQVRLDRGHELLQDGRGSVSEVAYAVGFRSVSHFSRTFREQHGVTPSAVMGAAEGDESSA